jgi:hypothetical protein
VTWDTLQREGDIHIKGDNLPVAGAIVSAVFAGVLLMTGQAAVGAQALDLPASVTEDPAALHAAMPALARAAMAEYRNDDRRIYLDTLFRLQLVAGDDEDAIKSLIELRKLNPSSLSPRPGAALFIYEILARARLEARRDAAALDKVLERQVRQTVATAIYWRPASVSAWILRACVS